MMRIWGCLVAIATIIAVCGCGSPNTTCSNVRTSFDLATWNSQDRSAAVSGSTAFKITARPQDPKPPNGGRPPVAVLVTVKTHGPRVGFDSYTLTDVDGNTKSTAQAGHGPLSLTLRSAKDGKLEVFGHQC